VHGDVTSLAEEEGLWARRRTALLREGFRRGELCTEAGGLLLRQRRCRLQCLLLQHAPVLHHDGCQHLRDVPCLEETTSRDRRREWHCRGSGRVCIGGYGCLCVRCRQHCGLRCYARQRQLAYRHSSRLWSARHLIQADYANVDCQQALETKCDGLIVMAM
jgi:hypothetical protein